MSQRPRPIRLAKHQTSVPASKAERGITATAAGCGLTAGCLAITLNAALVVAAVLGVIWLAQAVL